MNGRFQMQGGKNWFLPKEMNANRFFWDSHWLEIWSNHFYPSMGPNGGSVAMESATSSQITVRPDWICMRVVPLESPLKGHQPLCVFDFFISVLNIWNSFKVLRLFMQNWTQPPESVAMLPPFGPIEGQKWFDRISSQWESQKNRFALIYFGKIRFLPPCIWNMIKYPVRVVQPLPVQITGC